MCAGTGYIKRPARKRGRYENNGKRAGRVKTGKGTGMFMAEEERKYAYFMCSTYTIGGVRAERLLARFGSPQAVYEAETEEWRECVGNSASEAL